MLSSTNLWYVLELSICIERHCVSSSVWSSVQEESKEALKSYHEISSLVRERNKNNKIFNGQANIGGKYLIWLNFSFICGCL